ncbi:uncharacterized protein PHACADRAFT_188988 [Phanerochaete carnosa HHB-10118-sp]|uniref:Uncharacterized protein n=1 Tax=Phanerochaete carnosa (strain HHB-10118-sp) TaxID=650164 RepID=K5WFS8_PHACS|nr:uncharacterized protein PHACADRAFT_188988 [Phanerochaete carnosa HHB-10118-sp]EKM49052.1 hypothetical protein PHACADRAFT_188988 [Phanerochaete carnosa HHB-10118-sp]
MSISQVCHQWRAICLSTPLLWYQVSTDFPEKWMREALSRSGEVLLEVLINNQEGTLGRNIIWLALDELPRIKSLTWFRVSDFEKPEDNLPTPTLPFLESLAFYNTTNDLPRGLKLPRLTRLVAHNCSRFTWDHPILVPSLAHLDISGSPNCDLAHILRALRGMPLLQSLRLATVVPHPFAPPAPLCSSQRIALPELRRLILVDDLSQVTSFIYHVSLPVTASLYIKPKTERPSRWFSKYLSPAIRDRYEAVLNTTTCNISHPLQSIHYSNTGYWRAWSEVYPVEYLDEIAARGDCAPALQVSNIRIRVEEVAGDLTVINSICSAFLERHRITSLCLDLGVRSSSLGGWVKLLENLPRLRELAIMRYGVRELVRALSHSTPRATVLRDSEASSSLVVPSLQVLLLEGAVRRVSQGPEVASALCDARRARREGLHVGAAAPP